jgi:4-hydroxy-4-methyl-2-oxoglutarate aldolase
MNDIVKNYEKVGADILKKYSTLDESASINECLKVNGALNHDFRPVWPGTKIIGSAFTVRARAGDNLILHKAITLLKPGDILVVSCDGFQESGGMWGGIMSTAAKAMGCPGMIIDGCVRDTMMMKDIEWWVWSRGISVKRSTKCTGGQINHPIIIGNILVNPGDLVFADNDAVVIIPRAQAAEVYELAAAREKREEELLSKVRKDGTQTFNGNETFKAAFKHLNLSED